MTKISLVRCQDYTTQNVFTAVKRSVDLIGGMEYFVKPGMKVLLKPNLLSARLPEEAVDTHPEVVRAVGRLVKAAGGIVSIGDSPGGYGANIDEIFEKSGMKKVAREEGFELVRFSTPKFVKGVPIARQVFENDLVVSIPKLKTHMLTVFTGAIKNTYGMVTGLHKAECHSKAPREEDFARIIAMVYSLTKPRLSIMDGIVAMEGDGPSGGTPRAMNLVMASEDAVAIDACATKMIGLEPLDIHITKVAHEIKLGEADMSHIEIVGENLDGFIVKDFKLPQTLPLKVVPRPLINAVASMIKFKPYIDAKICARCNLCKITCPVNAIEINASGGQIDYKRCIRCLCCHEVCPYKAISIKRNILAKLVWG